ERPADDRGAPPLAAEDVRESAQQVRVDPRAVVVREDAVPRPRRDGFAADRAHARGDRVERFVPRGASPAVAPCRAKHWIEQPPRIVENLRRSLAADAQKAAAVGIVDVAGHARHAAIIDFDEHPAERGMAVHRAHRADHARHAIMISRAHPQRHFDGTGRAPHVAVRNPCLRLGAVALCVTLSACTLARPHYAPAPDVSVDRPAFARTLEGQADAELVHGNRAEVLLNGDEIFPAMLTAIRRAKTTITFANFVYEKGDIAREMTEALAERCRAGVGVNVLLDAVGSSHMPSAYKEHMKRSGCHVATYHSLNPLALKRINHRNHRRVLVVDGRVGFTGGTGVGDKWTGNGRSPDHWRQTDVRVEGPIVRQIQAAFAENWRDATGVLLSGDAYVPKIPARGRL